jgi:hypothetical protein
MTEGTPPPQQQTPPGETAAMDPHGWPSSDTSTSS